MPRFGSPRLQPTSSRWSARTRPLNSPQVAEATLTWLSLSPASRCSTYHWHFLHRPTARPGTVANIRAVRRITVELLTGLWRELQDAGVQEVPGKGLHRATGSLYPVHQFRAMVGCPQRGQRADATGRIKVVDQVTRIQTAHAVGDQVNTIGPDLLHEHLQHSGAVGDRAGGWHDGEVDGCSRCMQCLSDAAEITKPRPCLAYDIRTQDTVQEHDGLFRIRFCSTVYAGRPPV